MDALRQCVREHTRPGAVPLPNCKGWELVPKFAKSHPVGEYEE